MTNPEPEQRLTAAEVIDRCGKMLKTFADNDALRSAALWDDRWDPTRLSRALSVQMKLPEHPQCRCAENYSWLDESSEPPLRSTSPAPKPSPAVYHGADEPRSTKDFEGNRPAPSPSRSRPYSYSYTPKDSRTHLHGDSSTPKPTSKGSKGAEGMPPFDPPGLYPGNRSAGFAGDRGPFSKRFGGGDPSAASTARPTPLSIPSEYPGLSSPSSFTGNRFSDPLSSASSQSSGGSSSGGSNPLGVGYPPWYRPGSTLSGYDSCGFDDILGLASSRSDLSSAGGGLPRSASSTGFSFRGPRP